MTEIIDHRYSRQSYTLGQDVQIKLSIATVLVIGYNSLAQEIIRNLVLIGISKIDIFLVEKLNIFPNANLYYQSDDNIILLEEFKKLNPTIKIEIVDILDNLNNYDNNKISMYNVVILTNSNKTDSININNITHELNIPFIMCGSYGLTGYLFNDFGNNFIVEDIDGETPELLILDSIDNKILKFKDQHKLSANDIITINWSDNTTSEYKVYKKLSPKNVELYSLPNQNKNEYINIKRNLIIKKFKFDSLQQNINNITHIVADWSVDSNRNKFLHELYIAYDKYLYEYGISPKAWSISDFVKFKKYLKLETKEEELLAKKFSFTIEGELLVISSIIGGIVCHEVLKALAHKYIPIHQWYYMDYLDLIEDKEINNITEQTINIDNYNTETKYQKIVNIFGKEFLQKIQNTIPFIIGSGAIGCELIKNLGMLGVKEIYLTDPDHIEKSNLSRQFLFNDNDIRKSKAETAANKIKLMNPDVNVNVYKNKICSETENIFDINFHSHIDIYLNALDNIDARLYMDSQAIKYSKPLIDSGTMGSKGNVQVIIPYLTETYGSSKDPDDNNEGIPICTIKTFPYKPEHTIQWARELFESEFNILPNLLSKYKNYDEIKKINDCSSKNLLKQIYKYVGFEKTHNYYFKLLLIIFTENHINNIEEIINKYSKEENKEELKDKKLPQYLPINFNEINSNPNYWFEYLNIGFKLLNQIFDSDIKFNHTEILSLIMNNSGDMIFNYDFNYDFDEIDFHNIIKIIYSITKRIPTIKPLEFDKDDDELGHVNWIYLASSMRNLQYLIPQTDLHETRRIAGNIIPAMITTTSLIAGFQILEYIKICKLYYKNKYINSVYDKEINIYKNRYVNLNINYIDGSIPSNPKTYKLENSIVISDWTNFTVHSLNTIHILNEIESITKVKVEFITCGNITIYDGDSINIDCIDNLDTNNILILLEDIPIGIPLIIKL